MFLKRIFSSNSDTLTCFKSHRNHHLEVMFNFERKKKKPEPKKKNNGIVFHTIHDDTQIASSAWVLEIPRDELLGLLSIIFQWCQN